MIALRNRRLVAPVVQQLSLPLDAKPVAAALDRPVDIALAAIVVALIGFGVVMVYSASAVQATLHLHDPQFFLKRQAAYAIVGLAVFFLVGSVDYHRLYKLTYPVLGAVGALLVLCVVGFGHSGGGATRWLSVGPVHIQPAEMAKLALVCWLSYSLAKKADRVKTFTVNRPALGSVRRTSVCSPREGSITFFRMVTPPRCCLMPLTRNAQGATVQGSSGLITRAL